MMSDLISREDLIDWLTSRIIMLKGIYGDLGGAVSGVREMVKVMPSAEPERTAKVKLQDICWEDIRRYKEGMCASCGRSVYDHAKYCDECGCRLEWE